MNRRIGLAALTVLELPHEEQVSVAAQAGYSHAGLRLIPVAGQPVIHAFDASEVERRLADTGVGVLDVEVFRLTPQTDIREFEAVMAAAQRLGATELLVHGADSDEARLIESFGRLCDLAAGYGLDRAAANVPLGNMTCCPGGYSLAGWLLGYPSTSSTAEGLTWTAPRQNRWGARLPCLR